MAGFELARVGTVAEAAREWRVGRYIPLYLAGIVGGVALGIALTSLGSSAPVSRAYTAPAPVSAPVTADSGAAPVASTASGPDVTNYYVPQLPAGFMEHVAPAVVQAPAPTPVLKSTSAPAAAPQPQAPSAPAAPAAPAVPASSGKPNFYVPAVPTGGPTSEEIRLLDGINVERSNAGLAPYTFDAGLSKIARTRVQQMADQNYFAHTDPFGYSMYVELLAYFGYDSYAWAGENLALNNYASNEAAERALVSLMNSPTHKANILATDFTRIGVGEIDLPDGRHIFAMIFLG